MQCGANRLVNVKRMNHKNPGDIAGDIEINHLSKPNIFYNSKTYIKF
jgi:hypothetical protein